MKHSTKTGCAIFLLVCSFLIGIGYMIAFFVSAGTVNSTNDVWENGVSVTGTATKVKSFIPWSNVELAYEADGKETTANVTVDRKYIDDFDGEDNDGVGTVEIRYDPEKPDKPVIEGSLATAIDQKNTNFITLMVLAGIFAASLIFLIVLGVVTRTKKPSQPSYSFKTMEGGNIDLRSDAERKAEKNRSKPLRKPLESYAQQIAQLYKEKMDDGEREQALREIGLKMNDHDKQMYVAYRAMYLCNEGVKIGIGNMRDFSLRDLEYAWDGIGGWIK